MAQRASRAVSPTPLAYAVLGLVGIGPRSGYEIGRIFEETPMEIFSSSPGAIYPAIKRLAASGLVAHAPQQGSGRRVLVLTKEGRAALVRWLATPVRTEDVKRRMDQLLLRFAYMEFFVPRARIHAFLLEFNRALEAYVGELKRYAAQNRATMTPIGRLALQNGIELFTAHLRWGRRALVELERASRR